MQVQLNSSTPSTGAPARAAATSNGSPLPSDGTALPATSGVQTDTGTQGGRSPNAPRLVAALQTLQKMLAQREPPLQLTSELQGGYVVAKLVDPQTKAVLYQLPPEQVIKLAEHGLSPSGFLPQTLA